MSPRHVSFQMNRLLSVSVIAVCSKSSGGSRRMEEGKKKGLQKRRAEWRRSGKRRREKKKRPAGPQCYISSPLSSAGQRGWRAKRTGGRGAKDGGGGGLITCGGRRGNAASDDNKEEDGRDTDGVFPRGPAHVWEKCMKQTDGSGPLRSGPPLPGWLPSLLLPHHHFPLRGSIRLLSKKAAAADNELKSSLFSFTSIPKKKKRLQQQPGEPGASDQQLNSSR